MIERLKSVKLSPQGWAGYGVGVNMDGAWRRSVHLLRFPWVSFWFFWGEIVLIYWCRSAFHILRHPGITTRTLLPVVPELADVDPAVLSRVDIEGASALSFPSSPTSPHSTHAHLYARAGAYHPHLTRQAADVRLFMEDESLLLDPAMEYSAVPGLSSEVVEKLYRVRPTTIVRPSIPSFLLSFSSFLSFFPSEQDYKT